MDSFYGGRWGKSLKISRIFKNKVELIVDLNNQFSEVKDTDLVLISYGNDFENNLQIDNKINYNGTLWQKIYIYDKNVILTDIEILYNESNPNIAYQLLANLGGAAGPKGDTGAGLIIKELYASLSELEQAHPIGAAGDAYAVGTNFNNVIYLWSETTSSWFSIGNIQGPPAQWGSF